jgi:hypothetical protein
MIGKEYRTNKDMIGEIIQRCGEMWRDGRKKERRKKERERERERGSHSNLLVHQWVRSAIHALQQLAFPISFLSLKAPPPSCAHYH